MPELDLDVLQLVRVASLAHKICRQAPPFWYCWLPPLRSPTDSWRDLALRIGLAKQKPTTHQDFSQLGDRLCNSHDTLMGVYCRAMAVGVPLAT